MTKINVYLTFNGNCKEAFDFYQSVFGGDFAFIGTFGDMPPQEDAPPFSEEMKKQIMHVSLPISQETVLMGSDVGDMYSESFEQGNNFSISITADSKEDADRFFIQLSDGGIPKMPMSQTFWGDYFGMLTDKFGINWMVSFNENQ